MQHLAAFGYLSGVTGAGIMVNVTAKADAYLSQNNQGKYILPPQAPPWQGKLRVGMGYAQGPTASLARVNNATFLRVGYPSILPIQPALVVPSFFPLCNFGNNGPILPTADQFGVDMDATAAEVQTAGLWITDGVMNGPIAETFPLAFTSTITTVANAWTQGTLTFTQNLPVGVYAVYGMDLLGTTAIFARIIPTNGGPRPGVLARASTAIIPLPIFRNGNFGKFTEFSSYAVPNIEVFASSAAAITFNGVLDVQKIG